MAIAVCLAVLALLLARARLEQSFWVDETFSVLLTTYPVRVLVDLTAADSSPPLYYLLLKVWLKVGRTVAGESTVLFARMLGILALVGAWLALGWRTRRLFDTPTACLAVLGVAASAAGATMARDLRAYGLAAAALVTAAFLLLEIAERGVPADGAHRARLRLWAGFVACAAVALWAQLLSAIVLSVLALLWLGLVWLGLVARRSDRRRLLVEGVAAGLVTGLLFAPWLPRVAAQLDYVRGGAEWMTPPTLANLLATWTLWLPFGRVGFPGDPGLRWLPWWGGAALVAPWLGWLSFAPRASRLREPRTRAAVFLAATAVIVATLLWLLDRLGLADTFHGPRYPLIVGPILGLGLALAAGAGARNRPCVALLLLTPWLAAGLFGQWLALGQERTWGLAPRLDQAANLLPRPGEPVYLFPPALVPFYRQTFAAFDLRPIDELPAHLEPGSGFTAVSVSSWRQLDRPGDHLARAFLEPGRLGSSVERWGFPEGRPECEVYRVEEVDPGWLERLRRFGFTSALGREQAAQAALALPEAQRESDGWSFFEMTEDLRTYRWSSSAAVTLRFAPPAQGCKTLVLRGYRLPYPEEVVEMILATDDGTELDRWQQGPGEFERRISLAGAGLQAVRVTHPQWSPAEELGSGDRRRLGFQLLGAWLGECGPGGLG